MIRNMIMASQTGGTPWELNGYYANFGLPNYTSVKTQDANPTGVTFSSDGTKMYVVGNLNDRVYQYTLSTAWNIGTAVFLQNFSVATQDTNPNDVTFSSDGTKMYVIGATNDGVYQYTLSTAWNISTAVFLQNFSVATQDTNPTGVTFSSDGTKMYVVGYENDAVYQYNLTGA